MQYLKIGYNDVLNMPTNERRYYMGMLIKTKSDEQEAAEKARNSANPNAKGSRKTKVSGEALKNKIKSGEVPLT
jgi:hypothetical protein